MCLEHRWGVARDGRPAAAASEALLRGRGVRCDRREGDGNALGGALEACHLLLAGRKDEAVVLAGRACSVPASHGDGSTLAIGGRRQRREAWGAISVSKSCLALRRLSRPLERRLEGLAQPSLPVCQMRNMTKLKEWDKRHREARPSRVVHDNAAARPILPSDRGRRAAAPSSRSTTTAGRPSATEHLKL